MRILPLGWIRLRRGITVRSSVDRTMGVADGRRLWEYLLLRFVMRKCYILWVISAQSTAAIGYASEELENWPSTRVLENLVTLNLETRHTSLFFFGTSNGTAIHSGSRLYSGWEVVLGLGLMTCARVGRLCTMAR